MEKDAPSAEAAAAPVEDVFVQNIVVMRHGDRIDHYQPLWIAQAERRWDPPLIEEGKIRAWTVGKKLREIGFPLHRVFVSPFLRCRQTAVEVISALRAVVEDADALKGMETSQGVVVDPSKTKVCIEYGLSEMLGGDAILPHVAPEDGNWFPDISELEALLRPVGTIDQPFDRVYEEMPNWPEQIQAAEARFIEVIEALANKYPRENLLLVSHGAALEALIRTYMKGVQVYSVDYCATSHLQRQIRFDDQEAEPEPFKVIKLDSTIAHSGVLNS